MIKSDMELAREYSHHQSEDAFSELVLRHSGLVYSAALRRVRQPQIAQEVTQVVFILLARKAPSLGADTIVPAWLYRTACHVAGAALKRELRRQRREQEAFMQSSLDEIKADDAWRHLAPLLDEAMLALGEKDRAALVLRHFEGRTLAEVGTALGASEDAAKKRVQRALEKLQKFFVRRGVKSSTAVIAGAIAGNSVQTMPLPLAKTVAAMAATKGTAATGSVLSLMDSAARLMAWARLKMGLASGAGAVLLAGTVLVAVHEIRAVAAPTDEWRRVGAGVPSLDQLPPQVALLPSIYSGPGRRNVRGAGSGANRKIVGFGYDVRALFAAAFATNDARILFAVTPPYSRYDFVCTLPEHQGDALKSEIRKQLGLAGKLERRETDVLLLTVKYPDAGGLQRSTAPADSPASLQNPGRGILSAQNIGMDKLANRLEQSLGLPVVDRAGHVGDRYDFQLTWDQFDPMLNIEGLKQALVDELGLELVPSRESVEVVFVDNATN